MYYQKKNKRIKEQDKNLRYRQKTIAIARLNKKEETLDSRSRGSQENCTM